MVVHPRGEHLSDAAQRPDTVDGTESFSLQMFIIALTNPREYAFNA